MIEASDQGATKPLSEEELEQRIALELADQTGSQALKREVISLALGTVLTGRSTEVVAADRPKSRPRPGTKRIVTISDKKH